MTMQVPHPTSKRSVAPRRDRPQRENKEAQLLIFIRTLDSAKLEFTSLIPENNIKSDWNRLNVESHASSTNSRLFQTNSCGSSLCRYLKNFYIDSNFRTGN
ncbi:uncharacterized protein LOC117152037 isoform X2 [Bombus impatiens]|uniref:Uncharacterized protein LOC117152037 isoform X2 n=1 Tax=Bombus impatiens TaxID=132113 RepID=A0A6P8L921_BOMIM|nr:uncharacterized protein LOC117152037 isoform X2 [Bombus impatiens]